MTDSIENLDGGAVTGADRARRRFELYTILSLDLMLVVVFLAALLGVWARTMRWSLAQPAASALLLTCLVCSIWLIHRVLRRARIARALWVGFWALTALTCTAVVATRDDGALFREGAGGYFGALWPLLCAFTVVSLTPRWRRLLVWVPVAAAAFTAGAAAVGVPAVGLVILGVWAAAAAASGILIGALTFWMFDVIAQLDEARTTGARLAVAEERLRFSRDLHDVYGRTLSAIAVKSELAAEFAARGDERAVEQMRAVRELAQTSLTQVRGIVTGYREISLEAELAGAAAILRSAGARLVVRGLDEVSAALGPQGRTALAWAVREGVTNVIRHSRAGLVDVTGTLNQEVATVRIVNDGLSGAAEAAVEAADERTDDSGVADAAAAGTGLRGLTERVEAAGGSVEIVRDQRFALIVRLPLGGP